MGRDACFSSSWEKSRRTASTSPLILGSCAQQRQRLEPTCPEDTSESKGGPNDRDFGPNEVPIDRFSHSPWSCNSCTLFGLHILISEFHIALIKHTRAFVTGSRRSREASPSRTGWGSGCTRSAPPYRAPAETPGRAWPACAASRTSSTASPRPSPSESPTPYVPGLARPARLSP
jgi:hypothetical protein